MAMAGIPRGANWPCIEQRENTTLLKAPIFCVWQHFTLPEISFCNQIGRAWHLSEPSIVEQRDFAVRMCHEAPRALRLRQTFLGQCPRGRGQERGLYEHLQSHHGQALIHGGSLRRQAIG